MRRGMTVLALLVAAALAAVAGAVSVEEGEAGFGIALVRSEYVHNTDRTVFTYHVTTDGTDMTYWVLGQDCDTELPLVIGDSEWHGYGHDHASGKYGFSYRLGQDSSEASRVVSIEFEGEVLPSTGEATAVGHGVMTTFPIRVPGCTTAAGTYPGAPEPEPEAEITAQCDEELVTPDGADDEVVDDGECAGQQTVRRTFRNTEGDLTGAFVQTVHVVDTTAPVFDAVNHTLYVECGVDEWPELPEVSASDSCDPRPSDELMLEDVCITNQTGECEPELYQTRTWKAVDDCGNPSCVTQTVVKRDTLAPVLSGVPDDVTLECGVDDESGHEADASTVTAEDACGCFEGDPVVFEETRVEGCGNTYSLERVWTSTDCCGNTASETQSLRVVDTTAPVLTLDPVPAQDTFECDESVPTPRVVGADECSEAFTAGEPEITTTELSCPNNTQHDYKWTECDECGNEATLSWTATKLDRTKPVWTSDLPANVTVECGELPDVQIPTASDNCDEDVEVEYDFEVVNSDCCTEYVVIRTFTATDNCDNSIEHKQYITVVDLTPPEIVGVPDDLNVSCPSDLEESPLVGGPIEAALPAPAVTPAWDQECRVTSGQVTDTECKGNAGGHVLWLKDFDNRRFVFCDELGLCDSGSPEAGKWRDGMLDGEPARWVEGRLVNVGDHSLQFDVRFKIGEALPLGQLPCEGGDATKPETGVCNPAVKAEFKADCYDEDGPIDLRELQYYLNFAEAAALVGVSGTAAEGWAFELTMRGPAAMRGLGADNKGMWPDGFSTWLFYEVVARPSNWAEGHANLVAHAPGTKYLGDFNFDVHPCEPLICVSDGCRPCEDCNVTVTVESVRENLTCPNHYTITETYTATDCAGNSNSTDRVITVHDQDAPGLYPLPAPETVACDAVPDAADVKSYDSCECPWEEGSGEDVPDCLPVELVETEQDKVCNGTYVLNRTWTTEDSCFNTYQHTQLITVEDLEAPVFDETPASFTSECDDVQPRPTLTATDNCSPATVTEDDEQRENGDCANNYTLVWRYVAEDDCGNQASHTIRQTVQDTTAPTFEEVPADVTVECDAVPCPADVYADDNCDGLSMEYEQTRENGACPHTYTLLRTWTATDECGHSVQHTQTVEVQDTTAPVWNGTIDDYTVECDAITFPELPAVSDNCGTVNVTEHHSSGEADCEHTYKIFRAFLATDECGNSAWLNYTVQVEDTTEPTLSGVPADLSNECTLPEPVTVTADDNCDDEPVVRAAEDSEVSRDCDYGYVINRTYSAVDACGNVGSESHLLTVYDNTKPVLDAYPADASYECTAPAAENIDWSDNCGETGTAAPQTTEVSRECAHKYVEIRTWTATDDCGNTEEHNQTVTVYDDEAPTLSGVPADETVECDAVPCPATVSASDNCEGIYLNFTEERTNGSCPHSYTLTRTWTATDECDQVTTDSQTITVQDTQPPAVPSKDDITRECDETVAIDIPSAASIQDNCGEVTRENFTTVDQGSCTHNYTVNWSFLYTDECGNGAWLNFTETVYDATAPQAVSWIPAAPADATYNTRDRCEFPEPPTPVLTDNCDPAPTYSVANNTDVLPECEYERTRTHEYTYVDECGNEDGLTVTYTIQHTDAPTFKEALPGDLDEDCPYDDEDYASLTCVDACGNEWAAEFNQTKEDGPCEGKYTLTRTWTCTDVCGLESTHTQTVSVDDTTAPTFDQTPGDKTVDYSVNCTEYPFAEVTATDECSEALVVPRREEVSRECPYRYVENHIFDATDDCDNTATQSYQVNYTYTCKPKLSGVPADTTIECHEEPADATVTAEDCCGNSLTVNRLDDVITNEGAPQECANSFVVIRCWEATDSCGQTTKRCQNVYVQDTTPPVIDTSSIPGDQTVECGFVPGYPNVTVNDNCKGVELWLKVSEDIMEDCCWRHINRTWSAEDACGNKAVEVQQKIHVEDNIPPVLIGVPPDAVVSCPYELEHVEVEAGEPPLALGWCINADGAKADVCADADADSLDNIKLKDGTVGSLNFVADSTVIRWNDVVGKLFVRGQLADARGNGDLYDFVLEVSEKTDAPLAGVKELKDECYAADKVDPATWRFYEAVAGNLTGIAGTSTEGFEKCDFSVLAGEEPQNGMGANGRNQGPGLRAGLAIAGSTDTATLRLSLTADGQDSCDVGDHLFPRKEILKGDAGDADHPELECNETLPVTVTNTSEPGECGGEEIITRCWEAKDFHNNTVRECQVITVKDTTNPTLTGVPDDETISCEEDLPCPPTVSGDDECSNVTLTYAQSDPYDHECPHTYKIKRTWTVTDDCGNSQSDEQTIYVEDEKAPTFVGIPDMDGSYTCEETPEIPTVTATDNCDDDVPVTTTGPTKIVDVCPYTYTILYEYAAEDDCGNSNSDNWRYTVTDAIAPVIDAVADQTVNCDEAAPEANPTCQDSCEGEIAMGAPTEVWTNTSDCEFQLTRTWTCVDSCGNAATPVTQTITFVDNEAPTCEEPADSTIECTEDVPEQGSLTCGDNCDEDLQVATDSWILPGGCDANYTQVYQWTVTDCAGHSNTYQQEITVQDTVAPTLEGVPAEDATYTCRDDVEKPEKVCADDACSAVTLDFDETWTEGGLCRDQATAVRTWTATDACGHSVTESYSITVNDDVSPTCTPIADSTVACDKFVDQSAVKPSCSDECSAVSYAAFHEDEAGCESGCDYKKHYNWLVTDACGNPTWVNYTISVVDEYSPEFSDVPADATYECADEVPTPPTASHPCKDVSVETESVRTNGSCPYDYSIEYTYTAEGCCGETITDKTTITVQDTNAPTIETAPADVTVKCTEVPAAVDLQCSDDCSGTWTAAFNEVDPFTNADDECATRTITRTWTCTDECGLSTTATQTIEVVDNDAPVLSGLPDDVTQECDAIDLSHMASASDECDPDVPVNVTNTEGDYVCDDSYTITRRFSAVDNCGNEATATRYVKVVDTTKPVFQVCSCTDSDCEYCDSTTDCSQPPVEPALPSATDNCDADVEVTRHHYTEDGDCEDAYTQFYAYKAVDNCGNEEWLNFSVTVTDEESPDFEDFPADKSDECWDLDDLEEPTASDNCANDVLSGPNDPYFVLNETSTKVDGECENYTITREWTITDRCGNSETRAQTITVYDDDKPTFNEALPTDFTVECDEDPEPAVLTASDRCGSATVDFARTPGADDGDSCDSTRTETWTWTATDLCGNTEEHSITVTWQDTTAPELEGVPANTTVECDSIPCPATVSATDNCGGIELRYEETEEAGSCDSEKTIYRTWTATDCAGNSVSATQQINVVDTTAPVLDAAPADETVECGPEDPAVSLTAEDNCSEPNVTFVEEVTPGGCSKNYTVTRTWTATDACGNEATETQIVKVEDSKPPTADCEPMCWRPIKRESFLLFEQVSAPETGFFCVEDECSDITINVTGCTSNQDAALDASGAVFEIYDDGFNSHCFWSETDDKLWIFPVLLTDVIEGRTFVITGTAKDECGHEIDVTREIFVPLNASSLEGTPFDDYIEDCSPIPYNCTDLCPCETENQLCDVDATLDPTSASLTRTYDGSSDTTTFEWTFGAFPLADGVRLGFDIADYQVVGPAASTGHGFDLNTYVGGLRINSDDLTTVTVVLAGQVAASSSATTPVQFFVGGSEKCSNIMKVRGPEGPAVFAAGADGTVSGVISLATFRDGSGDFASPVPLAGAVVELIEADTSSGKTVLRTVYTNAAGEYSFTNLAGDVDADYKIQLRRDGVLSDFSESGKRITGRLSGPGTFVSGETVLVDIGTGTESADFPYGGPVDVSGGSADLGLVFEEGRDPSYERDTEGAFMGNARSINFWRFQLDGNADRHEGFTQLSDADIASFVATAVSATAGCGFDDNTLSTGTDAEANLFAAALNTAAGKGAFEPYDTAASWIFDACKGEICSGGSAENQAICLGLLQKVNAAGNGQ